MSLLKLTCKPYALFFTVLFYSLSVNSFANNCDCEAAIDIFDVGLTGCCAGPIISEGCAEPLTFEVRFNGALVPNQTQEAFCWSDDIPTGSGVGTWTLSVTDANGCEAFATAIATEACTDECDDCNVDFLVQGSCCLFSVSEDCVDPVYEWNLDGEPYEIPFGGDHSCGSFLENGTYTVTVTGADGCTGTDEINICNCQENLCEPLIAPSGDCSILLCAFGTCQLPGEFMVTTPNSTSIALVPNFVGCAGLDISEFGSGEYCVEYITDDGCVSKQSCVTMNNVPSIDVEILGFDCFAGDESLIATNPNGSFFDYCSPNYSVEWSDGSTGCFNACVCGETRTVVVTNLQTGCTGTDTYTPVKCDNAKFRSGENTNSLPSTLKTSMKINPNPTNGRININITSPSGLEGELNIFSASGQLLRSTRVEGLQANETRQMNIDLSGYPGNLFFVRYNDGLEPVTVRVSKY
ncbi:MAG: hypothetical protein AAF705_04790 [Bacteroidota bacterium]